jgi:release factor glutamine methyltransferase
MPSLRHHLDLGELTLKNGPHPEKARRDAELLLMHSLKRSRAWLITHDDELLADDLSASYAELLERRRKAEPIQYITGETEFYGLPFLVTPDVLIPRPETEHLVEKVIELASNFDAPQIVDVGTGSGAIAVALAHKLPQASITATDISSRALALAAENAKRNGVAVRFVAGDLLAPVVGEQFEIIVSNPPYVAMAERDSLDVEVREYEPALALFAGEDGLDVYRRLIPSAFDALTPGGFIVLEIGYGQSAAVSELLARAGFAQIEFVPDLRDIPRVACARRPSNRRIT